MINLSLRIPEANPFADPVAPRITVSQPELHMPQYVYLPLLGFFTTLPIATNWHVQTGIY